MSLLFIALRTSLNFQPKATVMKMCVRELEAAISTVFRTCVMSEVDGFEKLKSARSNITRREINPTMSLRALVRINNYLPAVFTVCALFLFIMTMSATTEQLRKSHSYSRRGHEPSRAPSKFELASFKYRPGITIGTVARGDEWSGQRTARKRAVMNTLLGLTKGFGARNVVVFVDTIESCRAVPSEFANIRCHEVSHCASEKYGSPTMDCVFRSLLALTTTDVVGFVNGDILVFESFPRSVDVISSRFEHFLMVGRRFLATEPPTLDLKNTSREWGVLESRVLSYPVAEGNAIDYFVFSTHDAQILQSLPPFVMGNPRWDNVLLALFYAKTDVHVVDCTFSAPILHQYSQGGQDERVALPHNHKLALDFIGDDWLSGTIDHADFIMQNSSNFVQSDFRVQLLCCAMREKKFSLVKDLPYDFDSWRRVLGLQACNVR